MIWHVAPTGPLRGELNVPGDKSVTHRAYILGAMASGKTVIEKPLRAEDTDNTLSAIVSLGVPVDDADHTVTVSGAGLDGLSEPGNILDLGNSGTGVRLLAGLLAGIPHYSVLTGDISLRSRPMKRIVDPLRKMGAGIDGRDSGSLLPLTIRGGGLKAIEYESPVASAQIKSCIILAGLQAEGQTIFREPSLSRDHTERMLEKMGVRIDMDGDALLINGGSALKGADITVPGDLSSAAFFIVAAAIIEGSEVTIRNVGVNRTRTGILELLKSMGADLEIVSLGDVGEPRADIHIRGRGGLKGVDVPHEWIPSIIDEIPLAAVAASACEGITRIRGASELRVKESDRISTTVQMLKKAGVKVTELEDGLIVEGGGSIMNAEHESSGDHRIAMASCILSLMAEGSSTITGTECVATSFPDFTDLMQVLSPDAVRPGNMP